MLTPLEMAKIGIRYFIRAVGWPTVVQIVKENKPPKKALDETKSVTRP